MITVWAIIIINRRVIWRFFNIYYLNRRFVTVKA